MKTLCFYFQVHQPFRLRNYRFFDISKNHDYYDDYNNKTIVRKVAKYCYLPTNELLLDMIREHENDFKVSFSISGVALDQFENYAPEVIESFKALAQTGKVEFLAETYAHSLASLTSEEEFIKQIHLHQEKIKQLFGQEPGVFRNTELIYDDKIGNTVAKLGFKAMISEGATHVLGWKSPQYLYYNPLNPKLKILLRNFGLSDDIAFRFSDKNWSQWPLTTEKYVSWLNRLDPKEKMVNVFISYETFGEHHPEETGIFSFLKALPRTLKNQSDFKFATPSEVVDIHSPIGALHVPSTIAWADVEKDLTAWLGNELQAEAFEKLYELKPLVDSIEDPAIRKDWLYLQTSDHFYYMSTKFFSDGDVHTYFNPYGSPYDAFINYMNVLSDFIVRVKK
ncbi:MAG: polysaccharide deacetylase family protein [Bacteroidia bacterium]|nr:polysaccharide deacetylase family protein [Bacteroidia bacterium]